MEGGQERPRPLHDAARRCHPVADEIWLRWEEARDQPGKWLLKRRYIKTFEVAGENGPQFGLSVFEWGKDGWSGSTVMVAQPERSATSRKRYVERQRDGFMLYRK
jgi:hypothetical protein